MMVSDGSLLQLLLILLLLVESKVRVIASAHSAIPSCARGRLHLLPSTVRGRGDDCESAFGTTSPGTRELIVS